MVPAAWEAPKSSIQTFYQNPDCYAASLSDCTSKISREHYISESILKRLHRYKSMRVQGLPWLAGKNSNTFPPDALTGKMLCEHHNSALSGLDVVALRLFDTLDAIVDGDETKQYNTIEIFNGHDLERWVLKVLCGLLASGNIADNGQVVVGEPNPLWVKILFQGLPFPNHWGLYFKGVPGNGIISSPSIGVTPLGYALSPASPTSLIGVIVSIYNFEFVLPLVPAPFNQYSEDTILSGCTFRPMSLTFSAGNVEKAIVFGWNAPVETRHIRIRRGKPADEENDQLSSPIED